MDFVQQIKKTPIVVNESRGFYTCRFQRSVYQRRHYHAARRHHTGAGSKTAPGLPDAGRLLAMRDEVSIDLSYHIREQTKKDLG
ncbi:MAG: hypothetical protein IPJ07_11005 [Acidobacteria bacterium]|nr:hypothetical protein [Acidobacteriota bacterium]